MYPHKTICLVAMIELYMLSIGWNGDVQILIQCERSHVKILYIYMYIYTIFKRRLFVNHN